MKLIYAPDVPACGHVEKCKHPHSYHILDQDEWVCLICSRAIPPTKFYPTAGICKHYKGGLYQVFGVVDVRKEQYTSGVLLFSASFSEEREAVALVYLVDTRRIALTKTSNHDGLHVAYYSLDKGMWWLRPLSMFLEAVEVDTENGKDRVLRFSPVIGVTP